MVAGPEMEVRLPRRRFPPGLPGFPGNLRKRHFLPFFRLCAAASSPALLCCSERGVAELLGCGLVRAALGMQSMAEPELKALMEQCTECVGGVSKTSRSAQAVPDPAQGAGATVPVPALRGQAQAKQPSCISPAQPSANT